MDRRPIERKERSLTLVRKLKRGVDCPAINQRGGKASRLARTRPDIPVPADPERARSTVLSPKHIRHGVKYVLLVGVEFHGQQISGHLPSLIPILPKEDMVKIFLVRPPYRCLSYDRAFWAQVLVLLPASSRN